MEDVGEKLAVDAVAGEGDVDPCGGGDKVLVGDGVLVVEDYVVGGGEKGGGHDLGDVGEVGVLPHVVGPQCQRATLLARRFCCQHQREQQKKTQHRFHWNKEKQSCVNVFVVVFVFVLGEVEESGLS